MPLNTSLLKDICEHVISKEGGGNINLILVDSDDMTYYNKYRNVEGPTDVLSFKYELPDLLGEIYVCPEYVRENSEYFKVPFGEEIVRVCIHGILHLFDYDHEKGDAKAELMFEKQENYVQEFSDSFDSIS